MNFRFIQYTILATVLIFSMNIHNIFTIYFSSQYWNSSNIRNGNISSSCSNGTNNPALVFGEGISYLPYSNFITSHSALTNLFNLSDDTNNIPPPTNIPVYSSLIPESTSNSIETTTTDYITFITTHINEAVLHLETQVTVSY